jgi:signal transduction histidine kinase
MEELAKERAEALIHAERLATLGTLAAGIAHEINNPSGVIAGNLQTMNRVMPDVVKALEETTSEDPQTVKMVKFAKTHFADMLEDSMASITRISNIVSNMKDFSHKHGHSNKEEDAVLFDISKRIDKSLELCHNELKYHVKVNTEIQDELPKLLGNPQKIDQILVNIFINAAHATQETGTGQLTIKCFKERRWVKVLVEDNGAGIKDEVIEHIFDPFYTTKPVGTGTGLGLSISKGLMEECGGKISAENREEGGARFILAFAIPKQDKNVY